MNKIIYLIPVIFLALSCNRSEINEAAAQNINHLFASDSGNSLTISLPDRILYSHETVRLVFEVKYLDEFVPEIPDWSLLTDSMSIIHMEEENTPNTKRIVLTLDSRLPGEYLINPLTVNFYTGSTLSDKIKSDFIALTISSSLIEGEENLIDDFDFVEINRNDYYLIAVVMVLLILISVAAVMLYRKIRKNKIDFHLPEKNYRAIVDNIEEENLINIYSLLSDTIKEFLDNKLFLSIQAQTTEEIIQSTKRNPMIEEWLKLQLYSFLQRADEIRFGSVIPDEDRVAGDLLFCSDFIDYIEKKVKEEIVL